MTLKEKLKKEGFSNVDYLSNIADDYAIEFAEWLLCQDITQRGKNNFVCADGVQRNTKELLEIYKAKNPKKYELKKEELLKRLELNKGIALRSICR